MKEEEKKVLTDTITKYEKAYYIAYMLDHGSNDFADFCEWEEKAGKYRYYNNTIGKIEYCSIKTLAQDFDNMCSDEEFIDFVAAKETKKPLPKHYKRNEE